MSSRVLRKESGEVRMASRTASCRVVACSLSALLTGLATPPRLSVISSYPAQSYPSTVGNSSARQATLGSAAPEETQKTSGTGVILQHSCSTVLTCPTAHPGTLYMNPIVCEL